MALLDGSLVTSVDHETVLIEVGAVVPADLSATILLYTLHGVIGVYIELDLRQRHET